MFDRLFMDILDMSKTAAVVISVVLLARLFLKKAPKVFSYALWAVVLFRLLCPFSLEAPVSIMPHLPATSSSYTLADLEAMGFPKNVVEGIALMTHDPAVPYMEYVTAIGRHPVARVVKLADLRHNSDLSRLDTVTDRDLQRAERYAAAITLLESMEKKEI